MKGASSMKILRYSQQNWGRPRLPTVRNTAWLGCGSMLVPTEEIQTLGAPVVVPGIAALKLCEDLIDMQLTQSKRAFCIPRRQSGEQA